jgi:Pyruvate/2-oxoacid:ferredoxin oxidoreductase gamma subunit
VILVITDRRNREIKAPIRISPLNRTHNGDANIYHANADHLEDIEEVLFYARDNMKFPCAFHLLSHVEHPDDFKKVKSDFSKLFKRALKRQYKKSEQEVPEVLLIYSIEFKTTTIDEINDTDNAFIKDENTSRIKLPFLHMHVCVIADCKKTIPQAFPKKAMQALNEIDGLTKARYFKTKPRYVSVYNDETKERIAQYMQEKLYKKLNTEFDDVYDRMTYIAKTEQKDRDKIPFKKAFGTSQLTKRKVTAGKTAEVATD